MRDALEFPRMTLMNVLGVTLGITAVISLSSAGCERSPWPRHDQGDDTSAETGHVETRYVETRYLEPRYIEAGARAEPLPPQRRPQLRALIAATRATSPLLRGVLQQLRSGEPLGLSIAPYIDDAHLAVRDGLILGALSLNLDQNIRQVSGFTGSIGMGEANEVSVGVKREELSHHRLASSKLWWAHRGGAREITAAEWRALITGSRAHWPQGERFQLCLRAAPDPLERLWGQAHPELASTLERARASGRWPTFDTDEQLIAHLNAHPGAVALFPVGNLKLWGAPLSQISIRGHHAPRVVASLELLSAHRWSEASRAPTQAQLIKRRLEQLIASLIDEAERASRVREWGWEP